jgi:hypothetical protein
MRVIGFNFTKINAEKFSENAKNLKINTGIDISDIKEVKSTFFKTKEEMIAVSFKYNISYEPDFAKLTFEGKVLLGVESKKAKEVLKMWKQEKVPEDFRLPVFNGILKKSSLRALQVGEELGLPPHFPLPTIKFNKQNQEQEKDRESKQKEDKEEPDED